jgi:hypothetical protein
MKILRISGSKGQGTGRGTIALAMPTCFGAAVVARRLKISNPMGRKDFRSQIGPGWMFALSAKNGT